VRRRRVLVTGAAKRLGRAIVLDLAAKGWDIALHYNASKAEAEATAQQARAAGADVTLCRAELAHEAEVLKLVAAAGPTDALVNNASIFEYDDWQTATRESWDRHMAINLRAPFVLSQEFARHLGARSGVIVNITDQRVFKPTPQFMSYGVSRAGLHWLTHTLAQALAPKVRVNAVAPGPSFVGARQNEEAFARQRASTILGRGASVADLVSAVRYLLEAETVTGETIAVDGGQHLAWKTADATVPE